MKNLFNEAKSLFENYQLREAQVKFEEIVESDDKNIEAKLYLGRIHSRVQNYGEALNYYNQVISEEPDNYYALTGIQLTKSILQLTNNYYYENAYTNENLYDY